jgi:lipopolysaccharide transport protein LptA
MRRCLFVLIVYILLAGIVKAGDEPVKAKSDKIWGDNKKKITYMEGNVRIEQGSTVIITETSQVDLDKKIAVFENQLQLVSADVTITADYLEYNFKSKVGTFLRNIVLSRKEVKDTQGNVTKDAFKLSAEDLYFESDTKNFKVKSQGTVEHKDFIGTADLIEYNDKKQELTFRGNAKIKRPSGEEIKGNEVVINTKDNSIIVDDKVKLVNEDVTILGDDLNYDYRKKQGVFNSNVILERAETKNARGKVTKDHFKLTTAGLDFESDTKNFKTKGKATVEHKDFTGSADHIEYNDKQQQMKFLNNAYLKRPKGEEIRGDMITIYINDKSFIVNNHVDINYKVDVNNENQTDKKRKRFP